MVEFLSACKSSLLLVERLEINVATVNELANATAIMKEFQLLRHLKLVLNEQVNLHVLEPLTSLESLEI